MQDDDDRREESGASRGTRHKTGMSHSAGSTWFLSVILLTIIVVATLWIVGAMEDDEDPSNLGEAAANNVTAQRYDSYCESPGFPTGSDAFSIRV